MSNDRTADLKLRDELEAQYAKAFMALGKQAQAVRILIGDPDYDDPTGARWGYAAQVCTEGATLAAEVRRLRTAIDRLEARLAAEDGTPVPLPPGVKP